MADTTTYDNFWSKAGPGLLDFGLGLYNKRQAQNEAAQRLQAARGPLYDRTTQAASGMLSQAGDFDPQKFATDRFNAGEALVAPVQEKQLNDLMSTLRARGQLGISTYNPGVAGITPNGTSMNPQLAAFFAAQGADRSRRAYDSLDQGQNYLDNLVKRTGMLNTQATNLQSTGIQAQNTQPSRAAATGEILKGAAGVLKNAGAVKDIFSALPGMISGGANWLKNIFSPSDTLLGGYDTGNDFSWI